MVILQRLGPLQQLRGRSTMSLDKAIEFGKEKRKTFRRSKSFDYSCRNHGSCPWCQENRHYQYLKESERLSEEAKEYFSKPISSILDEVSGLNVPT